MPESHRIQFACPHCRTPIVAPGDKVGVANPCPRCRREVIVPFAAPKRDRPWWFWTAVVLGLFTIPIGIGIVILAIVLIVDYYDERPRAI